MFLFHELHIKHCSKHLLNDGRSFSNSYIQNKLISECPLYTWPKIILKLVISLYLHLNNIPKHKVLWTGFIQGEKHDFLGILNIIREYLQCILTSCKNQGLCNALEVFFSDLDNLKPALANFAGWKVRTFKTQDLQFWNSKLFKVVWTLFEGKPSIMFFLTCGDIFNLLLSLFHKVRQFQMMLTKSIKRLQKIYEHLRCDVF